MENLTNKTSPQEDATSKNQVKFSISLLIIGVVLLLFSGILFGFFLGIKSNQIFPIPIGPIPVPPDQVACTLEAKLCPDGSSVGRVPPNCEFAPCPTIVPTQVLSSYTVPQDWQKYSKKFQELLFTFFYPPEYTISDYDEASGNITLFKKDDNSHMVLEIGRLAPSFQKEYASGSRREWFLEEFKKTRQEVPSSDILFEEVPISNRNYLKVYSKSSQWMGDYILDPEINFYFDIFNGKSVLVKDYKKLPRETVLTILGSLNAK